AQRAVEHAPGHISNHLALAFARLASRQWHAASQAAERGMQWAGWGGKIWLTAIGILARACASAPPVMQQQQCALLADALEAETRHFTPSESWGVVRDMLREAAVHTADCSEALVADTIALLEGVLTPEGYRSKWATAREVQTHDVVS